MHIKYSHVFVKIVLILFILSCSKESNNQSKNNSENSFNVELWLTNLDESSKFEKHTLIRKYDTITDQSLVIEINDDEKYQIIDGFGFSLTGGSAILLNELNESERNYILYELFSTDNENIGVSYLRLSIGASDLSDHVFSYNDLPAGQTDPDLSNFSLEEDQKDLIPVLKEILEINPGIKIMGSPWSAPTWMKTNNSSIGGSLKPEYFEAYANYFVKYIQGMEAEGITIDAITVQNEPLHPGNNPSMYMTASDQAKFIRENLGPAFENAGINTKIIIYDHNADRIYYPISILDDPEANKYIDGSAFHLYGGEIDDLSQVHDAHPDKHLYFTEQWIGAPGNFAESLSWHVRNLLIGATRNWCRNVLEWNLASDPNQDPHTDGGCTECLGAITIGEEITRNPAYYIVAHASKFVRPGSVRIESNVPGMIRNVTFLTPNGDMVLIVQNDYNENKSFNIRYKGKVISSTLNGGSVGTYVWSKSNDNL